MDKATETKEKIIAKFAAGLKHHLFSSDTYPKEVVIKTVYEECVQTLTISFEE